jgi:hypothetical protein
MRRDLAGGRRESHPTVYHVRDPDSCVRARSRLCLDVRAHVVALPDPGPQDRSRRVRILGLPE